MRKIENENNKENKTKKKKLNKNIKPKTTKK